RRCAVRRWLRAGGNIWPSGRASTRYLTVRWHRESSARTAQIKLAHRNGAKVANRRPIKPSNADDLSRNAYASSRRGELAHDQQGQARSLALLLRRFLKCIR